VQDRGARVAGKRESRLSTNLEPRRFLDNREHSEEFDRRLRRMARIQLTELTAFVAVAEHRSFTKAAAQVGIALPTMSQTIRSLEDGLGVRLFNRTTRSVALTEAGDRLLAEVQPILDGIDHAVESVNSFRDKPIGTLRLAIERSASQVLTARGFSPLIQPFMAEYPGVRVEMSIDDAHGDIISARFDAGIRLGQRIERDMTVLRLADDFKVLTVASPDYLARHPTPSVPTDLHGHNCIRCRTPWDGSMHPWSYIMGSQHADIAVEGSLIVNDIDLLLRVVLDGGGVGYLPEPIVASHIAQGRLVSLLQDWSITKPGIFLYHPSRRQPPMPLQVFLRFVETWRKRTPRAVAA
jgi:DNA-binding transcriptional LysR family regulator